MYSKYVQNQFSYHLKQNKSSLTHTVLYSQISVMKGFPEIYEYAKF